MTEDSLTAAGVRKWVASAYKGFEESGMHPDSLVITVKAPLDGRESSIRVRQTNLGSLICQAMMDAAPLARVALLNSGSVRLDDQLQGPVTEYDVIRTLPFGGKIFEMDVQGLLLGKILETGNKNAGSGGYLQVFTQGIPHISRDSIYHVVMPEFLLSGKETNLGFLTRDNPSITGVEEPANLVPNDIRLAFIRFLRKGSSDRRIN
jgi:hypothetical protein